MLHGNFKRLITCVTGDHRALQQRFLIRIIPNRRRVVRIGRVPWTKTSQECRMMRQVFERTNSPLVTANAATTTAASASWNRLKRRRVVLPVTAALTVSFVIATCCKSLQLLNDLSDIVNSIS